MKQLIQTENPTYRIVVALCKDYENREREIARQKKDRGTLMMYQHLNDTIDLSIAEVCEEGIRVTIRSDIGNGIGYSRTKLCCISSGTYKQRKRDSIIAIAKNLHLL